MGGGFIEERMKRVRTLCDYADEGRGGSKREACQVVDLFVIHCLG